MTSSWGLRRALRVVVTFGLALTFLLCGPLSASGQDLLLPEWEYDPGPDAGRLKRGTGKAAEVSWSLLNDTLSDTWSITKSPLHWRLKGWLAAAAIAGVTTGLIYGVDQRVRDAAQGNTGFNDFGEGIRWVATGPGLAALTGGFALTGFFFDRPKEMETARLLIEASASGFLFTAAGKYTIGRSRPRTNDSPFAFKPFSGSVSMPSGETTSAFIMAGVITSQYPHWAVQLSAYSLAAAVGAGRIALDAHWTSDVFISAALGIAVSKAVVYFNRKRAERRRLKGTTKNSTPERRHFFQISPRAFRWTIVY
ncbi:MAG: phosphatase PAP2 family protein [Myxococcota bacterium]|nr:phosphatase PAP2 family protein [Myxococcota bacterium]